MTKHKHLDLAVIIRLVVKKNNEITATVVLLAEHAQ